MPATYNLEFRQGETYGETVRVSKDLTGYAARAQIRKKYADAEAGAAALVDLTIVVGSDVDGWYISWSLTDEQTAAIPYTKTGKTYLWDLEAESPAGVVACYLEGTVTVNPEVTRG
jgi:hypothetical protein